MIRFPRKHIADSVAERIAKAQQQMNSVQRQGQRLDQALQMPIADVAPVEGIEDAIVGRSLDL